MALTTSREDSGKESEAKKTKTEDGEKKKEEEEISDDEEEIEFIPEAPPLRFKTESNAEVNQQYFMRSWCRTWARRKKVSVHSFEESSLQAGWFR